MPDTNKFNGNLKNIIDSLHEKFDFINITQGKSGEQPSSQHVSRPFLYTVRSNLKSFFSTPKEQRSLDRISRMARRILQADIAGIYLVSGHDLILKSSDELTKQNDSDLFVFQQVCNQAKDMKAPLFISDLSQSSVPDLSDSDDFSHSGLRSFACIPLYLSQDIVMGVLGIARREPGPWEAEDKENLKDLTDLVMMEFQLAMDVVQTKKLEQHVKEISKLAKIGGWEYDIQSKTLILTEGAIKILKLEPNRRYSLKDIFNLFPLKYKIKLLKACKNLVDQGEEFEKILHIYIPDNSRAWISVLGNQVTQNGEAVKIRGAIQNISARQRSENQISNYIDGLHALNEIFSTAHLSFDEQIHQALHHVASFLELPLGIISRIKDNVYQVEHIVNKNSTIKVKPTDSFLLGETYCDLTFSENKLVAISDMKASPYAKHPCYSNFNLDTYIGIPIIVDGEIYGTLNFSSVKKRPKPFSDHEKEFVQLFGKWVGTLIERRNSKQNLERTLKVISDYKRALDESAIVEMTDRKGNFIYVNDKFCEVSGYSREELLSGNYELINSGYHPSSYFQELWETISRGNVWKGEICNRKKNGDFYWVDTTIVPFLDEHDTPYQFIAINLDITKRKKAQKALIESEKRFRSIFESAATGIVLVNKDGTIINCNASFEKMLGYQSGELIGGNVGDLTHPYDFKKYTDMFRQMMDGKLQKLQIEKRYIRKNGEIMWGRLTTSLISSENNSSSYTIDMVVDITSQKTTETKLKESEQRFRGVFESAGVGIALVSKTGTIIRSNPALEKMLGYEAKELKGCEIADITYPEDLRTDLQLYKALMDGQRDMYQIEKRYLKKDGTRIWGRLTVSVIRSEHNAEPYAIGLVEDITAQKEAEIALRNSEKQYRDLFENAIEGIYQSAKNGRLIAANPAMAHILGFASADELLQSVQNLGKQIYVDESDRDELIDHLEKNKEIKNYHTQLKKKNGENIWVSISTRYLRDRSNQEYMEGTIQDITQQKLVEQQLKKAKEMAEDANRAKSEFLANVSHEIRTPMNAVLGFTDILSDMETDSQKRRYLEAINTSGKNLLNLINDILDLSKIEAGHLKLEYHVVNFNRLIEEIDNIFSLKMKEKGLAFEYEIDEDVPNGILIDEIRIRQVLLNLVGNAIKFTDQGKVCIRVKLNTKITIDLDTVSLKIEVSDTGIGIPKDQQDLIFQSFQQQSGQSNRKYGGTGLGLTISRRLVEKMGGHLSLESKVGVGSTFIINLDDVAIAAFDEPLADDSDVKGPIIFKESLVLVVDDVKLNNALIREYLKSTGLETIEAENGQEAIDLIRKYRPDIVLMDLKMPVMDGIEATRILKADPSTSKIPIIALTASIIQTEQNQFDRDIFDGFMEKPINKDSLTAEMAKFLEYDDDYAKEVIPQTPSDKQNNKGDYTLSEDLTDIKEDLLNELNGTLWKHWEQLNRTLIIGKVQDFTNELKEIDQKYGINVFHKYMNDLRSAANRFDVTELSKLLKEYPKIVSSVKTNN